MGLNPVFFSLHGNTGTTLPEAANAPQLVYPASRQNPYRLANEQRAARIAELAEEARLQAGSVRFGLGTIVIGAASVFMVSHFLSTPGIAGISLGMAGAALTSVSLVKKSLLDQQRLALENARS